MTLEKEILNYSSSGLLEPIKERLIHFSTDEKLKIISHNCYEAFFNACLHGQTNIIRYYLELAILKDKTDWHIFSCSALDQMLKARKTAFVMACQNGHLEIVRLILTYCQISINQNYIYLFFSQSSKQVLLGFNQGEALRAACGEGYESIVKLLLEYLDSKNMDDLITAWNNSCFNHACKQGYQSIAILLLEHSSLCLIKALACYDDVDVATVLDKYLSEAIIEKLINCDTNKDYFTEEEVNRLYALLKYFILKNEESYNEKISLVANHPALYSLIPESDLLMLALRRRNQFVIDLFLQRPELANKLIDTGLDPHYALQIN
jgi:ankyrin repeat protein